jgi:hypothetical protein
MAATRSEGFTWRQNRDPRADSIIAGLHNELGGGADSGERVARAAAGVAWTVGEKRRRTASGGAAAVDSASTGNGRKR